MKKDQIILGAFVFITLISGLQSCKKSDPLVKNQTPATTTVDNSNNQTARMWAAGKQLYAVGHNSSMKASLFKLNPPGSGGGTALNPTWYADFFNGTTQVTYVTGIAYGVGSIIISTGYASNYPNQILTYATTVPPFNAPTLVLCKGITDIEYNEYDGILYGIFVNTTAVKINPATGATLPLLSPSVPTGSILTGLCNYNGLISYCVSDNTPGTNDLFYSYNPASPTTPPSLTFNTTDWGTGDGGMQYLDTHGWAIFSYTDYKTLVSAISPYTATTPALVPGAPYLITDLTSN